MNITDLDAATTARHLPFVPTTSRRRRVLEALSFVATWIGLGYALHLDSNIYLLVGIPLTLAFQVGVRRRPVHELWVRDGGPFRLDTRARLIALALAVLPAVYLVMALRARAWVESAWIVACLAGAPAAGYAIAKLGPGRMSGTRAAATALAIGAVIFQVALIPQIATTGSPDALTMLGIGVRSALLYLPVTFVLEEVTFRGLLDSHVHAPGESRGWLSALFVSAIWGLWHLPTEPVTESLPVMIAGLLAVHCAIGVALSFAWRRSGNLALPAAAHALIDGVRNGLQAGL